MMPCITFQSNLQMLQAQTIKGNATQPETLGENSSGLPAASQQTHTHQKPTVAFGMTSLQHLAEISQDSQ